MTPVVRHPSAEALAALQRLREELGGETVLLDDAIPQRNCADWSGLAAVRPLAVIRPTSTQVVSDVLKACQDAGLPVVPQGGLTGLCGGARPDQGSVVLSLERMTGIEEIDPASATLTVKAGTPLEIVQRAAEDAGFFFPLDLGARGSCAIGGNLSTNAGGNRVIRYGMARELVLGLEVVLPDGAIITSLNKMIKNNAGYDLKQLFIGSEGTLGVITRVVLRLFPQPGCVLTALCAVPDYAGVVRLLGEARRSLGPLLSAFEVMWPEYLEVIRDEIGVRDPLAGTEGIQVLVEAQGMDEAHDAPRFDAWLERLMENGLLSNAALARSVADARSFWALRDACAEFLPVLGPHGAYDIGLPVAAMDDYVQQCKAALAQAIPGCRSVYYGHVGDGNMHLVLWVPGLGHEEQPKQRMDEVVYGLVRTFSGTVSAEHGIGTLKKPWLAHARSQAELALMQRLKHAIDPKGLLNPGKVLSSL